jgi:hypothetical protein
MHASAEVMLYDVNEDGQVFFERDFTCPYLCPRHIAENEQSLQGARRPAAVSNYKYTNQHCAQGFSVYRPL